MNERFARIPERAAGCRELSARDWRVLAAIYLHVDTKGNAHPSMGRIAAITGIDRCHVAHSISRLENLGFLGRQRRRREGMGWDRNTYLITYEGVLPQTATDVAADGNRGVAESGHKGVASDGTLNSPVEQPIKNAAGAASDPEKPLFDFGKKILGRNAGGQVRRLISHHGGDHEATWATLERAARKSNPREYVGAILRGEARADDVLAETDRLLRDLAVLV